MTNNKSDRWPIAMIVAVCIFMLLGCVSLLQLRGNLDNPNIWIKGVCLVIGVGLWARQNWARWLGIVWCLQDFFVKAWLMQQRGYNQAKFIWCLVFLALVAILFKYPFKEEAELSPPEVSEEDSH